MYAVTRQTAILPYKIGRISTSKKCILEDVAREDVVVVSRKQVEQRRALRSGIRLGSAGAFVVIIIDDGPTKSTAHHRLSE
jgi:hypothetical protein